MMQEKDREGLLGAMSPTGINQQAGGSAPCRWLHAVPQSPGRPPWPGGRSGSRSTARACTTRPLVPGTARPPLLACTNPSHGGSMSTLRDS